MSRRSERAMLGVLGFSIAVLAMLAAYQLMADGDALAIAAESMDSTEQLEPASTVDGSDESSVLSEAAGRLSDPPKASVPDPLSVPTSSSSSSSTVPSAVTFEQTDTGPSLSTSTSMSMTGTESTLPTSTSTVTVSEENTVSTIDSDTSTSPVQASPSSTATPAGFSDVERDMIRLTNELRTNPAGPHRRVAPMPQCVDDDDEIEVDSATGHPKPLEPLRLSESVSIRMSRDWSQQMAEADSMSHRSTESQNAIYEELGIDWVARGENVAWAVGYDLSDVALLFFRGWRESDGHYCNMMSGAVTDIGIGHVRTEEGKDFATQNFYRGR